MISTIARIAIPLVARRAAPVTGAVAARSAFLPSAASSFSHSLLRVPFIAHRQQVRMYSAGGALSQDDIKSRIMEILTGFEKVDPSKVREDLGHQVAFPSSRSSRSTDSNEHEGFGENYVVCVLKVFHNG
jgi:hypothetical protein